MNKKIYKIFLVSCALLLFFNPNPAWGSTKSDIQKDTDGWKTHIASLSAQPNKLLEKQDTFLKKVQKWVAVGIAGRVNSVNWDRYNEFYFSARTAENLARQELVMAQVSLDKEMFEEAQEHLELVSWQSRKWILYDQAASEVWLGNLTKAQQIEYEAGKTVNKTVGFVGKTVNKIAEKTGNPAIATMGKSLEWETTALNFVLDWGFQNLPTATKNTIKDKAVDIFADVAVKEYINVSGGIGSMVASDFRLATGITRLQNEIKTPVKASRETLVFIEKELANDPSLSRDTIVNAHEQLNKVPIITIKVSEDNNFSLSNSASPQQPAQDQPTDTEVPKDSGQQPIAKVIKPWKLVSGDPTDTCTAPTYTGEVQVHGWYEFEKTYQEEQWVLHITDEDTKILPLYDYSQKINDNFNSAVVLINASPELEQKLKKASKDNPEIITLKGYELYCEGGPVVNVQTPAVKSNTSAPAQNQQTKQLEQQSQPVTTIPALDKTTAEKVLFQALITKTTVSAFEYNQEFNDYCFGVFILAGYGKYLDSLVSSGYVQQREAGAGCIKFLDSSNPYLVKGADGRIKELIRTTPKSVEIIEIKTITDMVYEVKYKFTNTLTPFAWMSSTSNPQETGSGSVTFQRDKSCWEVNFLVRTQEVCL